MPKHLLQYLLSPTKMIMKIRDSIGAEVEIGADVEIEIGAEGGSKLCSSSTAPTAGRGR